MASISDYVYDAALSKLDIEGNAIYICAAEPTTYLMATGADNGTTQRGLGNVALIAGDIPAPAARAGGGREVTVGAKTGGSVTTSGTATHYAIVDTVNSRLLVTAAIQTPQAVTSGNTFSTATFKVGIPPAV